MEEIEPILSALTLSSTLQLVDCGNLASSLFGSIDIQLTHLVLQLNTVVMLDTILLEVPLHIVSVMEHGVMLLQLVKVKIMF